MIVSSLASNPHLKSVRYANQLVEQMRSLESLTNSNAENVEVNNILEMAETLRSKISVHVMKWTTRAIESEIDIDSELKYEAETQGW